MNGFNVQLSPTPKSTYLLQWLNLQKQALGQSQKLTTFQQALDQCFLYQLLIQIDSISFKQFANFSTRKKMDTIQKYVNKQFGKRIKWAYKQYLSDLSQQKNIIQFTKLVCFFSIHSTNKNEIINRILSLPDQTQSYLMQQMQQVQNKLQNITEIRKIIQQIQYLQQQNQNLEEKINEMAKINTEMLALLKQSEQQNRTSKAEVEKYRKQKYQVFATLNIDYISEYMYVYNRVRQENDRYVDIIRDTQTKLEYTQRNISQYQDKIKSDFVTITNLTDQIAKLKEIISEKDQQHDWFDVSADSKFNIFNNIASNKQNSKCSTSILSRTTQPPIQYLSYTSIQNSNSNSNLMYQWQNSERQQIRTHNDQLLTKLQTMYKKYNQISKQCVELRQKNKKLRKTNKYLKKTILQIQMTYNQFKYQYKTHQNQKHFIFDQLAVVKLI